MAVTHSTCGGWNREETGSWCTVKSHDQGAALRFVDGVHVVLHNRLQDRLVEAVHGRDHVEAGVLDRKAARLRQGIKKVEGSIFLLLLRIACEGGRSGVGQQGLLRALRPDVRGCDDRRANGVVRDKCPTLRG